MQNKDLVIKYSAQENVCCSLLAHTKNSSDRRHLNYNIYCVQIHLFSVKVLIQNNIISKNLMNKKSNMGKDTRHTV